MLARFAKQEYDILLGTQMVAKGLDFGNVTLVGVLGIDSLLFGQGFRSYENVFSLITQVVRPAAAGRTAGSGIDSNRRAGSPCAPVGRSAGLPRVLPAGDHVPQVLALSAVLLILRGQFFRCAGDGSISGCAAFLPPFWGSSSLHTPASRCVCLAPPP